MDIQGLVRRFQNSPNWIMCPPCGPPKLSDDPIAPDAKIPDEVLQLYELCGDLKTIPNLESDVAFEIVPPDSFR